MAYRGYNRFSLFPGSVLGLDRLALAAPGWPVPLSCSAGGSACYPLAALWRLCSGFYGLAYILIAGIISTDLLSCEIERKEKVLESL